MALTSFVGRERDLPQLRALLAEQRLVSLVGPGGGKTRLAAEALRLPSGETAPEARFVELATSEDLRFPDAEGGPAGLGTRAMHWYLDRVIQLTTERADVRQRFMAVSNMLASPGALFHPAVAARVLWCGAAGSPVRTETIEYLTEP